MPFYSYWCQKLGETPRFHRKQWEFVFICHVLYERGYLKDKNNAIGFGVGKEPLASLFASFGVNVLATDLDVENAKLLGWVETNQHSQDILDLNERKLCSDDLLKEKVRFRNIDMNHIPNDLGKFDFCWSIPRNCHEMVASEAVWADVCGKSISAASPIDLDKFWRPTTS